MPQLFRSLQASIAMMRSRFTSSSRVLSRARSAVGSLAPGNVSRRSFDLAKDYAISRETVRQAIGILERRGLVIRRRAKGTFVAAQRLT